MSINFVQLLQDSWNFIRNQRLFSLWAVGLLSALQFGLLFLQSSQAVSEQHLSSPIAFENLWSLFLSAGISVLINIMMILNIKSINNGQYQHFKQSLFPAFKAFFPVILLTLMMVMPLSIGIAFGGTASVSATMGLIALPLLLTGIYFFLRLCLVVYAYLIEEPKLSLNQTLRFVWELGRGRVILILLFVLLGYIVPGILNVLLTSTNGVFFDALGIILSSFFSLFSVVFNFRFYQVFRQLPRKEIQ